ncbi:MAG: hypothetical protein LBR69_03450 [Endomicrobium sp.]|jgi:hypothetical protein|nr:hypothetical protein [Endomicrobium sp.]
MKYFFAGLLKLVGFLSMAYGLFIIIRWYIYWISYNFLGSIEISMIIGLATFFLSPLAGIIDLFWHSFMDSTVNMWIEFLVAFVAGKLLFGIGHRNGRKEY